MIDLINRDLEWTEKERMQVMAYVRRLENALHLARSALSLTATEQEKATGRLEVESVLSPYMERPTGMRMGYLMPGLQPPLTDQEISQQQRIADYAAGKRNDY